MNSFITVTIAKSGKKMAIGIDDIISFYEISADPRSEPSGCRIEIRHSTIEVDDKFDDLVQKMICPHIVYS